MAILGKLFGTGRGMSPARMAPRPAPAISQPPTAIGAPVPPPPSSIGRPTPPMSIGGPGGGIAIGRPVAPPTNIGRPLPPVSIGGPGGMPTIPPVMQGPMPVQGGPVPVPSGIPTTRPPANVLPGAPPQNISPPQPITVGPVTPPGSITPIGGGEREAGILPVPEGLPTPEFTTGLPADDIVSALPVGPSIPFTPPTDTVVGRPVESPISIGRTGRGPRDQRMFPGGSPTFNERGERFIPPADFEQQKNNNMLLSLPEGFAPPNLSQMGTLQPLARGDEMVFAGGSPTFDETGGDLLSGAPGFSNTGVGSAPEQIGEVGVMAGSPTAETTDQAIATTGDPATPPPAQTIPTPPGTVDPVIMGQVADETISDPLLRALYFGTADQPGFYNQLQQVGANLLGAQAPETEYDPSMTEKFFNPFEDQVVQQTIDDVIKAGEQRDIAARAQDIGRGGLSAFGSRARLTADERQQELGRGLAQELANIRQRGFSEAQRTGLSEFDRQYGRDISQLYRPLNILQGIGGLLPGYQAAGTQLRTTYGMPADPSALGLGAALGAYSSLAPRTGSVFDALGQTTGQG